MGKRTEAILDRVPDRIREFLSDWHFWVGVAYVGLAIVSIWLYVLFEHQTNETARRIAIQRSAAQASLSSCVGAVRNAPVVAGFLDAHRAIITNSILATTAALQTGTADDPLRPIRKASLKRLEKALRNVDELDELVVNRTPTKASCDRLARSLGLAEPFARS